MKMFTVIRIDGFRIATHRVVESMHWAEAIERELTCCDVTDQGHPGALGQSGYLSLLHFFIHLWQVRWLGLVRS